MATNDVTNEYRSERKKRMAKAAKKTGKKAVDTVKIASAIIYSLLAVLAIALISLVLYQFGVPQRILPAVKVDNKSYSVAEYEYYYMNAFQNYANGSSSAGFSLFDPKKDPRAQMTKDEDDNEISYAEFFRKNAIDSIKNTNYYLELAKAEGIELSEESKQHIDETISAIEKNAEGSGVSASRYISLLYGNGCNLKIFKELLANQEIVEQYLTNMSQDIIDNISDNDVQAEYDKDPIAYQAVDIRLLGKKVPTDAASEETEEKEDAKPVATKEEVEAAANEMLGKITDEASFIELAKEYCDEGDKETFKNESASLLRSLKNSIVKSNIGEDLAEWLFSTKRVEGDKRVYVKDDYVYVIYIVKTSYRNDEPLVNARHVLISFDDKAAELAANEAEETEETKKEETDKALVASDGTKIDAKGTSYDAKVILEAYEDAKKVLDEYKAGENTEEAFAALAEKYSKDTGSVGENATNGGGGLYKDIEKGQMVSEFENWVYDAKRQPGDTDIIRTTYGYHVMYFVSKNEDPAWKLEIKNTLANTAMEEKQKELNDANEKNANEAGFGKWAYNEALKIIDKYYVGRS